MDSLGISLFPCHLMVFIVVADLRHIRGIPLRRNECSKKIPPQQDKTEEAEKIDETL